MARWASGDQRAGDPPTSARPAAPPAGSMQQRPSDVLLGLLVDLAMWYEDQDQCRAQNLHASDSVEARRRRPCQIPEPADQVGTDESGKVAKRFDQGDATSGRAARQQHRRHLPERRKGAEDTRYRDDE